MEKITIGDLVQLKSGGAEMVVSDHYHDPETGIDKTKVWCVWHDLLQNEQKSVYPVSGLVKVK